MTKATAKESRAGRWSWEYGPRHVTVVISPKGRRYVPARTMEYADLIIDHGTRDASGWRHPGGLRIRLRRFEKSSVAKQAKKDARDAERQTRAQHERKKAKQKKRKRAQKLKRTT